MMQDKEVTKLIEKIVKVAPEAGGVLLRPLPRPQRVLGGPGGEGLRQDSRQLRGTDPRFCYPDGTGPFRILFLLPHWSEFAADQ